MQNQCLHRAAGIHYYRAHRGLQQAIVVVPERSIAGGSCFIVGGQLAYVAEVGETIKAPNGESDARLRVIYANSTESNLLRRSLQ